MPSSEVMYPGISQNPTKQWFHVTVKAFKTQEHWVHMRIPGSLEVHGGMFRI
jgi:hypothetical protein